MYPKSYSLTSRPLGWSRPKQATSVRWLSDWCRSTAVQLCLSNMTSASLCSIRIEWWRLILGGSLRRVRLTRSVSTHPFKLPTWVSREPDELGVSRETPWWTLKLGGVRALILEQSTIPKQLHNLFGEPLHQAIVRMGHCS